mmetsp:Transcript_9144/g.22421  ORF Transcript_9144/g.22421 Transcript_9144/m.22421 type:complete len:355 (-) Transcript_9144:818-1882(-)
MNVEQWPHSMDTSFSSSSEKGICLPFSSRRLTISTRPITFRSPSPSCPVFVPTSPSSTASNTGPNNRVHFLSTPAAMAACRTSLCVNRSSLAMSLMLRTFLLCTTQCLVPPSVRATRSSSCVERLSIKCSASSTVTLWRLPGTASAMSLSFQDSLRRQSASNRMLTWLSIAASFTSRTQAFRMSFACTFRRTFLAALHTCFWSSSTMYRAQRSTLQRSEPSSARVEKMVASARCRFSRSFLSRSMNNKLVMPRRQPESTPSAMARVLTRRTESRASWSGVRSLTGSPSLLNAASTNPPKHTPLVSEQIWPIAAAVIVANPKVAPRVQSIKSPAWIMIRLSITPKPIMGTAHCSA